jgi:hypothetical protein
MRSKHSRIWQQGKPRAKSKREGKVQRIKIAKSKGDERNQCANYLDFDPLILWTFRSWTVLAPHVENRMSYAPQRHLGAVVVIAHDFAVDAEAVVRDLQMVDMGFAILA